MNFFRKYAVILKVSLSNTVAYRIQVVSGLCFYTLFIYIFMALWAAIYKEGNVHGYTYVQIVWYLIITELIQFGCKSDVRQAMNDDVKSGNIAYLLGRPVHYIFYQLANSLGQILFNLCCFGILAVILGFVFAGPLETFSLINLPPVILSFALSVLQNYFLLMLIGLSSFVMEDNFAIYLIYQKLCFMLGVFLPVEFLPSWLQDIALNLPFSYIAWAPAKLFVDFSPALFAQILPHQIMWTAMAAGLCFLAYHGGVKKLQVNGG
jgi:ABC-2 type transport system permease protein